MLIVAGICMLSAWKIFLYWQVKILGVQNWLSLFFSKLKWWWWPYTCHFSLLKKKSFIPLLCWKTACSVAWENCIILLIVLIFSPVITWRTPFFSLTLSLLSSLYIAHAWPQQNASTHAASYLALHYIYTWYVQWLGIYMYVAVRRNTLAQTLTQPLFFFIYFIYL
jgi:hypothetical protein